MQKIRLKSGDVVEVITGEDRGKTGKIIHVDHKKHCIYVQGVNMLKKHKKADQQSNQPGGIIDREGPIHPSNVKAIQ